MHKAIITTKVPFGQWSRGTLVAILFCMQNKIQNQIKDAMRAKDQVRLTTMRGMLAAFTNELVAKGQKPNEVLGEQEAVVVVRRLVKQRKDSIEQFEKGGRQDLADSEKAELLILEEFLPTQMSEEKIREIVKLKIEKLGMKDMTKAGIIIGAVMKETAGEADGAVVKKIAEEMLS